MVHATVELTDRDADKYERLQSELESALVTQHPFHLIYSA